MKESTRKSSEPELHYSSSKQKVRQPDQSVTEGMTLELPKTRDEICVNQGGSQESQIPRVLRIPLNDISNFKDPPKFLLIPPGNSINLNMHNPTFLLQHGPKSNGPATHSKPIV